MLVLQTEAKLEPEHKDYIRQEIKEHTGEDCIILDMGLTLSRLEIKKEQPLWRRLFHLS